MMVQSTILAFLGLLMLSVQLTEARGIGWLWNCNKERVTCINNKKIRTCGFNPTDNTFKVYKSECALHAHACKHQLSIAVRPMQECETPLKEESKAESKAGRGSADSPPESAFVRPENIVTPEGADITITCYAIGGNPPPKFSWKIVPQIDPGAKSGEIPETILSPVTTSTLTLEKITKEKSGTYTCTAYNLGGSVSVSTTIDVQYKPTATVKPAYKSIKVGENTRFKCTSDGNPKPTIVWMKDSKTISTSNWLVVSNARQSDHGNYRCVAHNVISTYNAEVRLNVRVDGGWSEDTSCTQCGKNPYNNHKCQKKCERKCNNPTPLNGGQECSGDRYYARDCSEDNCKVPNKKKDCFPGDAVVPLANGGTAYMRDLKIGEDVLAVTSDNRVVSSKVLTFLHREEESSAAYTNIQTDEETISISSNHLIFVSEDGKSEHLQATFASNIKPGMYVNEVKAGEGHLARVKAIFNNTKTGKYAPLTEHGNIVVNHVMSSCYAVINSHWLAHIGLSPLRWYYMYGGLVHDDVPKQGIHWYPTLIEPMLTFLPQS